MRDKIYTLVVGAIETLNEDLDYESLEDVGEETPIYGGPESIDSLSLVTLLADIEHSVSGAFGIKVILADEQALSSRERPYSCVGSLIDFTLQRVQQKL